MPSFYSLDLLVEESRKRGIVYGLPSDDDAWRAACENHACLIVPVAGDEASYAITCAIISREPGHPVLDLRPTVERDAPSLLNRYSGYVYETDENGVRLDKEPQRWKHAD